jgi:hypothetical protein
MVDYQIKKLKKISIIYKIQKQGLTQKLLTGEWQVKSEAEKMCEENYNE